MNRTEANLLAEQSRTEAINSEIEKVISIIHREALMGRFSTTFRTEDGTFRYDLLDEVTEYLNTNGYTTVRKPTTLSISWETFQASL